MLSRNPSDKEDGSAGMMALFVIGLMMLLFLFIMFGGVMDYLKDMFTYSSNLSGFPVSDERTGAMNFIIIAYTVIPFLGILVPLTLYALIISVRKGSGGLD